MRITRELVKMINVEKHIPKICIGGRPQKIQKLSMTKLIISYIHLVEKYRPDIILKNRAILKARNENKEQKK